MYERESKDEDRSLRGRGFKAAKVTSGSLSGMLITWYRAVMGSVPGVKPRLQE